MAGKIRFITHNLGDTATALSATSEVAALPIENVQLVPRSKVWRSTSGVAQTITGDFAASSSISGFVLGRHNLTEDSTVVITLHDAIGGGGSIIETSGTITVSAQQAYESASALEFQDLRNISYFWTNPDGTKDLQTGVLSYKVVIAPGGGTNTFFDVGRIIVGDYIEPTYNISYGFGVTWDEKTKQYRTDSGSLRSDVAIPYKLLTFDLKTISEVDRVILGEAFADVGKRKDFFVTMFPDDTSDAKAADFSGIVKLNKMPKYTGIQCDWYNSKYTMEEV